MRLRNLLCCVLLTCVELLSFGGTEQVSPTSLSYALLVRAIEKGQFPLRCLVVGASTPQSGVALVGDALVRAGSTLRQSVEGVEIAPLVTSVTGSGLELSLDGHTARLRSSYQNLPAPTNPSPDMINYLEASAVPLESVLRLISDQSGLNIATSDKTRATTVSILLRHVRATVAVEEICRATGLWYRAEASSGIMRVTTLAEYAENLRSFREEKTEAFTLLYPNVVEAAGVIYGLYPERTLLSLGEEEIDEDPENDLSRRFRRFQMIADNGGSTFLQMEAPDANTSSGTRGSGVFSYSRGGGAERLGSSWDWLKRASRVRNLSPAEAQKIEHALASSNTNLYEQVYGQATTQAASIFVTMSRKSNMLFVRTGDEEALTQIRELIKRIDVPTPMVLLEVKVLELDVTDEFDASVKWTLTDLDRASGLNTHTLGHAGDDIKNLVAQSLMAGKTAVDPTLSFMVVSDRVRAQIDLMQKDGKAKVLATPTLLTANNEVSRIFSGSEYPLVTGWTKADTTTTDGVVVQGAPTVQIEKKDIGDMLLITPNINADKTVTLRVLQENSSVDPTKKVSIPVNGGTGESKDIEYVESRSIAGTFIAKDGLTILAGGLIREAESETYWRTPFLGSLPLLGALFRGTEKRKTRSELVVLIKPHVISTPMEGGRISDEVLKALSAHPARDGRPSLMIHKKEPPSTTSK